MVRMDVRPLLDTPTRRTARLFSFELIVVIKANITNLHTLQITAMEASNPSLLTDKGYATLAGRALVPNSELIDTADAPCRGVGRRRHGLRRWTGGI